MTGSRGGAAPRVSFDRVADAYDRTRALPERTMRRVLELLRAELAGPGRCLEIGVGSGRLALPLHDADIPMAGVDVSPAMLARLREKTGGAWPFPIALADATALPFPQGSMGAGLAAHVLHVIADWTAALRELARVVRPGGVILIDVGNWGGKGEWATLRDRFCEEAGIRRPFVGTQDPAEVGEYMGSLGAACRVLPPIRETISVTAEEQISSLEEGLYSFTWQLDDQARRAAAARTRNWARDHMGPLDVPRRRVRRIVWRAYDLP
ncbi:MAG: class I SAM-dependent methyltransferase [Actinobacteria bacterium]|nr:MAG: class I SAM-dependent methyltransferase [Actinomycetota bacterium]